MLQKKNPTHSSCQSASFSWFCSLLMFCVFGLGHSSTVATYQNGILLYNRLYYDIQLFFCMEAPNKTAPAITTKHSIFIWVLLVYWNSFNINAGQRHFFPLPFFIIFWLLITFESKAIILIIVFCCDWMDKLLWFRGNVDAFFEHHVYLWTNTGIVKISWKYPMSTYT